AGAVDPAAPIEPARVSAVSKGGSRFQGRWKRPITAAIAVAVVSLGAFLLYRTLSQYQVDEIVQSLTSLSALRLLVAAACAAGSYLCLTGFDWLAVRYAGKPLPWRKAAVASFVSLSVGHNLGFAAVSSGAIRYRFYSRYGLSAGAIAKVILFCGMTVGLGLSVLGGISVLLRPREAETMLRLGGPLTTAIAIACLLVPTAYVVLAARVRKPLAVWSVSLALPQWRLALAQVIIG